MSTLKIDNKYPAAAAAPNNVILIKGDTGTPGEKGEQGNSGVYIGNTAPTSADYQVWIDTSGDPDLTIVQTTGSSTSAVMSQKAVTDSINDKFDVELSINLFDYRTAVYGESINSSSAFYSNASMYRTGFIKINPGDRYEVLLYTVSGSPTTAQSRIAFYRDADTATKTGTRQDVTTSTTIAKSVVAPNDAHYMAVSVSGTNETYAKRLMIIQSSSSVLYPEYVEYKEYVTIKDSDYLNQASIYRNDDMIAYQYAYIGQHLNYTIVGIDSAYISVTVDDANTDIGKIAKIFNEYNYPLNAAIPPTRLDIDTSAYSADLINVKECLNYIVEHGGEVLSHSGTVITSNNKYDYNTMLKQFRNNKVELVNAGYVVNGIILTGGTGEVYHDAVTDIWARKYYCYSDRYGLKEPYYHPRTNIAKTTLAAVKNAVDDAVSNHKYLSLTFHGLYEDGVTTDGTAVYSNGFRESDLRTILDYIKTKTDAGSATVCNYGYVYDIFGQYGG